MSLLGEIGVGVGSWVIQEIVEEIMEEDEAVLRQNSAVPEVFVPPEKGIKSIHVRYEGAGVADAYYEILVDGDVVRSGLTDDRGDIPSFVADPGTYDVTVVKEVEGGYYYGETTFEIVVGEHFHNDLNVIFVPSPTPPDDIEEKLDDIKEEVRTIEDGMFYIRPIIGDMQDVVGEIRDDTGTTRPQVGLAVAKLDSMEVLLEEIRECACAERPEVLPRCTGDPNDTQSTCFMMVWIVWREYPGGGSNDGRADLLEPTEGVLYQIQGVFYDHLHRHREAYHVVEVTNSGAWEDAWKGYESMFEDFIRVLLFERAQKGISQTQLIHGITQFYQWVTTFNESDPFSPQPLIHFLPELPRELLFIGVPEDEITHQMLFQKLLEMEGELIEVERTPWWAWVSLVGFLITLGGSIGLAYKKR